MKKIIYKIVIVILFVFVIDRLLGYTLEKLVFEKTFSGERGGSLNFLVTKKKQVRFLVLGSSRAKQHINPDQLSALNGSGYNAGISGVGTTLYSSVILEIALLNGLKPEFVILQTDPVNFFSGNDIKYARELIPLYNYYDKSPLLREYAGSLGFTEKFKLHFLLYRFNGKLFNLLFNYAKRNSVVDNNGFDAQAAIIDTKKPLNKYIDRKNKDTSKIQIEALKNIKTMCDKNHIKLFIVLPPSYDNVLYDQDSGEKFINYISSGLHIRIFDMSNIYNFTELQAPVNWKDGIHMNKTGAKIFSNMLNDSLRNQFSQTVSP